MLIFDDLFAQLSLTTSGSRTAYAIYVVGLGMEHPFMSPVLIEGSINVLDILGLEEIEGWLRFFFCFFVLYVCWVSFQQFQFLASFFSGGIIKTESHTILPLKDLSNT